MIQNIQAEDQMSTGFNMLKISKKLLKILHQIFPVYRFIVVGFFF